MSDSGGLPVYNGRYQLHRQLGRGGMAVVHLAHDQLLDRPVAVKVLNADFAGDPTSESLSRLTCLVVCLPLPILSLTSPVFRPRPGIIAFMRVDLPAPDCPANMLILPLRSSFSFPTPSFFGADRVMKL